MNRYCNLDPIAKIKDDFPNISTGFDLVQADIDEAIEDLEEQGVLIDALQTGDSGAAANAARVSTPYATTFPTLKDRVDHTDSEVIAHKADYAKEVGKVFNVQGYGAKGDGITIDSAFITNAVTALTNAGGGILYFPPGKYVLNAPITIANIDIVIEGAGVQLSQLFFTGSNGIAYTSTNLFSDCIQIHDLSVITLTNNLYTGILITFPSNIGSPWRNTIIENVVVSGATSIAAYNDGSNNSQTGAQNWVNGIRLINAAVSVVRDYIFRAGASGTSESGGNGILLEGYTVDVLIQGCKIFAADIGIKKNDAGEGLVIDNCMLINVDYGIYINQGAVSQSGVYASIQNCHINYCNSGIVALYHPQITVQNCLMYKQSAATGGSDINLNFCGRSKILSNTCSVNIGGGSSDGIVIANSANCLIHDNLVEDRVTGVWLQATATNCKLLGNRISGNTTNMLDQGSGNYYEKNKYIATILKVLSAGATTVDVALPTGIFTSKPSAGFMCTADGTQYIIGFYTYDSASSTAINARFNIKRMDGVAITAETVRFNVELIE
jgi:parallel beta-helix repeat protein